MFGDRFCFCQGESKYTGNGTEIKEEKKGTLEPKKKRNIVIVFLRKIFGINDYANQIWCDGRDKETERNTMGLPYLNSKKHRKNTYQPHSNVFRPLSL